MSALRVQPGHRAPTQAPQRALTHRYTLDPGTYLITADRGVLTFESITPPSDPPLDPES